MVAIDCYLERRPEIPGPTCPDINELQRTLRELARDLSSHPTEDGDTEKFLCNIAGDIEDIADDPKPWRSEQPIIEQLRSANDKLRESSQYWRDAAEELAAEVDELREKLEEVEEDLLIARADIDHASC